MIQSNDLLKEKLGNEITKFDLCSLIKFLEHIGYESETLLFKSHYSNASASSLCEGVEFKEDHILKGILMLNLGLLSGNSPLTDFFKKCLEDPSLDADQLLHFLRFFDHHLIKNLMQTVMPERLLKPDGESMASNHLQMLGLNCVSSIHWFIQLCFPELKVNVEKKMRRAKQRMTGFCLGHGRLGDNHPLGDIFYQNTFTFQITLSSDTALTASSVAWPIEIHRRLKMLVLPHIKKMKAKPTIYFHMPFYDVPAQLSTKSYLGYGSLGFREAPVDILVL
jgi:hypothetical protein